MGDRLGTLGAVGNNLFFPDDGASSDGKGHLWPISFTMMVPFLLGKAAVALLSILAWQQPPIWLVRPLSPFVACCNHPSSDGKTHILLASLTNGHITLNTPVLVRSLKLSNVEPSQYLDG